jgi:aryl carrier-like protein
MARNLLQPLLQSAETRNRALRDCPDLLDQALNSVEALLAPWRTR